MCRRLVTLLLVGACLSQAAMAQINPFRGTRGTPLNDADIAALTAATNRLLDQPQLSVGATDSWSNPASGASGTVTAGNAVHRKGMACRIIRYVNSSPGPRGQRSANLTWCKTKDGWKLG